MDSFKLFSQSDVTAFVNQREGESRLGEKAHTISGLDQLANCPAQFVVVGIPEDIGVRANYGVGGAATTWMPALKAFLNMQSNAFLTGAEVCIAGYFDIKEPADQSVSGLRNKVSTIDTLVYPVIERIVAAGKVPIVIGGGHNNACPILAGVFLGGNKAVNTINIDAHADLRPVSEGRHSGNGFSAAIAQGYLNEYHIFGLHESYNNQYILDTIAASEKIKAVYFDSLLKSDSPVQESWKEFTRSIPSPCGLEIDLDSVENSLSSAVTPSGFALNTVRRLVAASAKKLAYLHICEGAFKMADGRESAATAKTVAYLVSDFIKAQMALK